MFARPIGTSVLMLALGAAPALAMDMQGKWGFGVGAGFASNSDFSIIRGRSQSSAWLLDLNFSGANLTGQVDLTPGEQSPLNQSQASVQLAPGVRRFLRPGAEFSPYLDFFASASYARNHNYQGGSSFLRYDAATWGAGIGMAIGGEYFTPWHFSLAAHADVANVGWRWYENTNESSFAKSENSANGVVGVLGLSPRLILRAYF